MVEAFTPEIEQALAHPVDFKSALQERLARRGTVVTYDDRRRGGPAARADLRGRRDGRGRSRSPAAPGARRRTPSRPPPRRRWSPWPRRDGMHLSSITLKGFKSFPDRTRLTFSPGRVGDRRPERLGQVQHHRRRAVGDGRAVAARRPRPVDAGRDLRRRARRAGALRGRGRGRARQRLRRAGPAGRRGLDPAPAQPRGGGRVPHQRRQVPARRRDRDPVGHRPGQGDALGRLPGPRRGDRHLQAARPADADRGGGRARQAPQAPPPRAAQARAHAGQPGSRAGRRARGAHAAEALEAPGRGRRAARADRAPERRGALDAGPRRCPLRPRRAVGRRGRGRGRARRRRGDRGGAGRRRRAPRGRRGGAVRARLRAREPVVALLLRPVRRRADRDAPGVRPAHRGRAGRARRPPR